MKSDQAWREWGRRDPYYGVLSDQKFRRKNLQDNIASFNQSGETHWAMVRGNLERLYGADTMDALVDFGCGVGRVLRPMSENARRAIGIDVSPDMLAEAARNCPGAELILSDESLSGLNGPVDLVHSFIVLQHIPVDRGMNFIKLLLGHLRPGGFAALHMTLQRPQQLSRRVIYFLKHRVPGMRPVFNMLQGKQINEPVMQINQYNLFAVIDLFSHLGMEGIFLKPIVDDSTHSVMIFARKAK